ncbi:MAG TPA: hypothetical protein VF522_16055 [Ramlibacter sp.]|uniref:hypothetical protein n=1 Tax=Ramlibacter sp. TaxID=1917967 RepID=UPI002ED6A684
MAGKTPPRYVPTLTEVVHSGPVPLAPAPGVSQEQLVQRVLQRVELVLDRRVRETLATAILEQTSQLMPLVHERLEGLVRQLVAEAIAEEMGTRGPRGG